MIQSIQPRLRRQGRAMMMSGLLLTGMAAIGSVVKVLVGGGVTSAQAGNLTMTAVVSGCYYAGGQSRRTVSVEVAWSLLPDPETITVSLPGAIGSVTRTITSRTTGNPPIVTPQLVTFEIPATFTGTLTVSSASGVTGNTVPISETGSCVPLVCGATDLGGRVFADYDGDGVRDPGDTYGFGNVTVSGYDRTGQLYTTTTDSAGRYCLTVPVANYPVRVEFTTLPSPAGRVGTNSGSSVQFLAAPSASVDLGVSDMENYCQSDPWVMTPCYVFGDPLRGPGQDAMVRVR